ncbi:MAG: trimeric intracellular cation channel family protein [Clostridia bacterium]|nr:trimeric intracellular cation channel family protein [Clostridia bacterium]
MLPETVLSILELIGTVSFAVSGALVAIKAGMDLFGVVFIGWITAFGGGILRDLLIGRTPPAAFLNPFMFLAACLAAIVVFIIAYVKRAHFDAFRGHLDYINNFFDAIGLATFAVMGTEVAFIYGFSDNVLLSVILGMLTCVGGGIFRDILTDTTPYVFKKHVYALAAIAGSSLYYLLRVSVDVAVPSSLLSILLVVTIRMLATKYRWSLPKIRLEEDFSRPSNKEAPIEKNRRQKILKKATEEAIKDKKIKRQKEVDN